MSVLRIEGLRATVAGHEILRGVDLEITSGEVHAIMGPNGSGKSTLSHVLMGHPDYEVTGGTVTIDGTDVLALPTWGRARAGLFLAMQYPVEVPGVPLDALVGAAAGEDRADAVAREAAAVGLRPELLARGVNDEFSGGEKKRAETVQLAVLRPAFALLDEIDSGLDVDGLRQVARRISELARTEGIGVCAITHYARLLDDLRPDHVHVFLGGRIARTGGPDLADELERTGYEALARELGIAEITVRPTAAPDPFGDPTADPLA